MNANKRQFKLAFVNEDANAAQALIDASNTICAGRERLLEAGRGVAQRGDPGGGAARGDRPAAEQRASRAARRGGARRCRRVADAGLELPRQRVFCAAERLRAAESAQEPRRSGRRRPDLDARTSFPRRRCSSCPRPADLATIIAEGRLHRPEVLQAQDKAHEADIDRAFAKNQSLPQADLKVQYLSNGFAGLLTPVPPFLTERMLAAPR